MDFTGQYHHHFPGVQPYQAFVPVDGLEPSAVPADCLSSASTSTPHNTFDAEHYRAYDFAPGFANPAAAAFARQLPAPRSANGCVPGLDGVDEAVALHRGSDDDDVMTPAQSRRKAQNRAAQRAFRERKERHVKDLEAKLATLEAAQQKSCDENDRLKRDLDKIATENDILRATSALGASRRTGSVSLSLSPSPASVTGPAAQYTPQEFYSSVLQGGGGGGGGGESPVPRPVASDGGERLLAVGAAWDLIISHHLYSRGLVDVGDVSERLRSVARCDGLEPVFPESAILHAIEQSVASGSDDLL